MTHGARTLAYPDREFWNRRSVFVTGHTGFQGSWLSLWLSELGANVVGFSLPAEEPTNLFSHPRDLPLVTCIFGDIRDPVEIMEALVAASPSVVIHLAAQAIQPRSYLDPVETFATNVMGTVHLLEAMRLAGSVQAAVMVTSDKCYENTGQSQSFAENAVLVSMAA